MKHLIVVCGTFWEWLEFRNCFKFKNRITQSTIRGGPFTVDNSITYHCLVVNNYNKLMGFKKTTTNVIRIGTWYKSITEETEKFLDLFKWG